MSPELPTVMVGGEPELPVVRINGDVDHANADPVESEVLAALAGSAAAVLDLSAVTFLDSAGVRLVDRVAAALGAGPSPPLRVLAPQPSPARYALVLCAFPAPLLCTAVEQALTQLG